MRFATISRGNFCFMISLIILLAGAKVEAGTDILAQSKSGKVLCSNPDVSAKTCSSITSYESSADGSVLETTEVLLTPHQPLTLTMAIASQVTARTSCGVMTLNDLRRGQIRLNGEALPANQRIRVLERLKASMGLLAGNRVCDAIRMEDGHLVKYGQIDGVDIKLPAKPVMWAPQEDGYKVAPR